MLFRQLLLATSATAFLVVPETSDNEDGIFRTLPVDVETYEIPANALAQSLQVPCPQCRGRDTHLKLDFTIESKRLLVNGFELYPNADPWQGDLTAAVIKGNGKSKDRRLGYGLGIRPEGMDEGQHLEVIGVELLIIEVGDRFVDGIPPVGIKLIKALTGDILIGSIDLNGLTPNDFDCDTLLCQVSSLLKGAWAGFKNPLKGMGCHGKMGHAHGHKGHGHKGHHHGQHESQHEQDSKKHGEKAHGHGKSGHKHHHHHEKSWSVVKHVASYIFLPVIVGMTAGVGVAVLTMFICTLIVRFIRLFIGERQETPLYVDDKIAVRNFIVTEDEEQATGLMEQYDAPPEYEDEPSPSKE